MKKFYLVCFSVVSLVSGKTGENPETTEVDQTMPQCFVNRDPHRSQEREGEVKI